MLNSVACDDGGFEQLRNRIELRPLAVAGECARQAHQFELQRGQRAANIVVNLLRDRTPLILFRAFKMLREFAQPGFAFSERCDRRARLAPGIGRLQAVLQR